MKIALTTMLAATLVTQASSASAQSKRTAITVQGAFGLPLGDFGDAADMGLGALVGIEHRLGTQFSIAARTGLIYFVTEFDGFTLMDFPLWVGGKFHFRPGARGGFVRGDLGFNILYADIDGLDSDTETELGINLGGGWEFGKFSLEGMLSILSLDEAGDSMMLSFLGGTKF